MTYDGDPHTATYTITGVETDPGAAGTSINVTGTTHTPAGTYNGDPWSFNGGNNYNDQNGTVDDHIGKANATVVVTAYNVTYDGDPHTATYTITGVGTDPGAGGTSINVTATTHTAAGTYNGDPWSFNGGNNYNDQNGTVGDHRRGGEGVCRGRRPTTLPMTAIGTRRPTRSPVWEPTLGQQAGSINVTQRPTPGPGTYNNDPWSFNGGNNYNDQSGTVNDHIGKANATVVVTAYNVTYDGDPHTATYTITGVGTDPGAAGTSINVTATTHTLAGIYNNDPWSFNGGNNYNDQSGTVDDHIGKANATVMVTAYTCPSTIYDGVSHTATYTLSGVHGETGAAVGTVDVSNTTHTNAGTYSSDYWFFTGSGNYNDIGNTTITDCIAKRSATWTTNPNSKTYGDPDPNPITTGSGSNFVPADNVTATYSRAPGQTVLGRSVSHHRGAKRNAAVDARQLHHHEHWRGVHDQSQGSGRHGEQPDEDLRGHGDLCWHGVYRWDGSVSDWRQCHERDADERGRCSDCDFYFPRAEL